jgi:hypothetical protein
MPLGFQRLSGKGVLDQVIEGMWPTSAMWHVHRVSPVAMEAFDDIKITLSLSFMEADLAEIYAKVRRLSAVPEGYECRDDLSDYFAMVQPGFRPVLAN